MAAPWTFEVNDCFRLPDRGPVVSGRIIKGEIHEGHRFGVGDTAIRGTVRGLSLVRTTYRDAVGLLVDVEVAPGEQMFAVVDEH